MGVDAEQGGEPPAAPSVFAEIGTDLATVEEKLVCLAEAMSEDYYGWRPHWKGCARAGELSMYVMADNYLLPALAPGRRYRSTSKSRPWTTSRSWCFDQPPTVRRSSTR